MERSDLEQYATEGNLARAVAWRPWRPLATLTAAVVDVGAGNGILGLGALMLGATSVRLIEADPSVAEVAKRNASEAGREVEVTVLAVQAAVDLGSVGGAVLISNPPWGVQTTGADRPILEAMFTSEAEVIHLMHHAGAGHVEALRQAMDGTQRTSSAPRSACRSSMRISAADGATPRCFAAVSRVLEGGTH